MLRSLATLMLGGGPLLLAACASHRAEPLPRRAANDVTKEALAQVGKPYRWGGSSPRHGFDCSGLVQHVYREALGIELPRTSREMGTRGTKVARADLAPGDLVFFQTGRHPNSHVGIYIGRGRFVHAPSSGSIVRVEAIDEADAGAGTTRLVGRLRSSSTVSPRRSSVPSPSLVSPRRRSHSPRCQ